MKYGGKKGAETVKYKRDDEKKVSYADFIEQAISESKSNKKPETTKG